MASAGSSSDEEFYDYFDQEVGVCYNDIDEHDPDPEYFEYECLTIDCVKRLLQKCIEDLCGSLLVCKQKTIMPSLAKLLLYTNNWAVRDIILRYSENANHVLEHSRVKPVKPRDCDMQVVHTNSSAACTICVQILPSKIFFGLECGDYFCKECWSRHFEVQINQGLAADIECMGEKCKLLVPEDFLLSILKEPSLCEKYQKISFSDYVKSNPNLKYCPGPDCDKIIYAKELQSKRVTCECKTSFCFNCGTDYHAPADCEAMKKWLKNAMADSETANYISAYTKLCPACRVSIEKDGGCNHIRCSKCKHEFCWVCLHEWKDHTSATHDCNRYKETHDGDKHDQAKEALQKYLFYFERWDNHTKSLHLEEQTLKTIRDKVNAKVMTNQGTWIDWQYLFEAGALLAKCRYTLKYTYPYAYYLHSSRRSLFEHQQSKLEHEIEKLSWKIERADNSDRGDMENQMDIVEKMRTTLLKDVYENV